MKGPVDSMTSPTTEASAALPADVNDDIVETKEGAKRHAGVKSVPAWDVGELPDAPKFSWRDWAGLLGPGLVMGGAAIGGGEWVTGPLNASKFGPWLFWLATCSIMGQVIYNLEISRYTLYSGEPIFTGKFRVWPGPWFWLFAYLLFDFGTLLPYLAGTAAQPLAAMFLGRLAITNDPSPFLFGDATFGLSEKGLVWLLSYVVFFAAIAPLMIGGKIYNSVKTITSFKVFFVLGFLTLLAVMFNYRNPTIWRDIGLGFVNFGGLPVRMGEDLNGNGRLDPGEDWDGDEHLDVVEPRARYAIDRDGDGKPDEFLAKENVALSEEAINAAKAAVGRTKADKQGPQVYWAYDRDVDGRPDEWVPTPADGVVPKFDDVDGDKRCDGYRVKNAFVSLWEGKGFPTIDVTVLAMLFTMAAISGSGGLTNTTVSAYTRDQGWGMGKHVGAIPSMIGGHAIELSHVGMVFRVTAESLTRWRKWYWHVFRDQVIVWAPACFIGLALPSLLSLLFLKRGVEVPEWDAAAMTATGVGEAVAKDYFPWAQQLFFRTTLFCGVLVLWPSLLTTIDGFLRRWVDVLWTTFPAFSKWETKHIGRLYFAVLIGYTALGCVALAMAKPKFLTELIGVFYNVALAISCFQTLVVNTTMLPKPLRPGWFSRICLFIAGMFFFVIAVAAVAEKLGFI